ncbi:MAG: ABC transporter substrate-binding protein [Candidatus Aminicenantes bacterium]|jgi:branched-chain amino acid transport system substrate-binding protein
MKQKRTLLISVLTICIAISLVFLPSCAKGKKSEEASAIKIGAILPLTGNLAQTGVPEMNAMKLALNKIISKDSDIKMRINFYDFKGIPNEAISLFRKAVNIDGCQIIFASTSLSVNTLLPLVKEKKDKVIFFTITTQKDVIVSDNVFRVWPDVTQEMQILSDYFNNQNGDIVLYYATNQLGMDAYNLFKINIREKQRIVAEEGHSLDVHDFKNLLLKTSIKLNKKTEDKILLAWTYPKQTIGALKAVSDLNIKFKNIVTSIGTNYPEVLDFIKNLKQKPFFVIPKYDMDLQNNTGISFDEEYFINYKEHSSWNSAFAYDNIMFLYEGIRNFVNNEWEISELISSLENTEIDGVTGKIKMMKNHQAKVSLILVTLDEEGKFIASE